MRIIKKYNKTKLSSRKIKNTLEISKTYKKHKKKMSWLADWLAGLLEGGGSVWAGLAGWAAGQTCRGWLAVWLAPSSSSSSQARLPGLAWLPGGAAGQITGSKKQKNNGNKQKKQKKQSCPAEKTKKPWK